jgi:hypothetical protein
MFCRFRITMLVLASALVLSTLSAGTALAAKGHGGGGGGTGPTSATLTVNPSPAPAYSYTQVSGCGYAAGVEVNLNVVEPGAIAFGSALADSTGCFSLTWWVNAAGIYTLTTYQNLSAKKSTLMASYTLIVQ